VFTGIPDEATAWYRGLEADNSKAYFTAHRDVFETAVREPMTALVTALEDEFGPAVLFRPHRDTRFSGDKSPYKTHQGAFAAVEAGIGWYLQVSATGLVTGGGFHHHAPDQVSRYRDAVDDDTAGTALQRVVDGLAVAGFTLHGDRLATRPRGVDAGHPRLELLRHRSLTALRDHGCPDWLATADALERVRADWRAYRPLVEWVLEHVGPATEASRRH
jgi:uncharacterized protein (TIGR02453 family)